MPGSKNNNKITVEALLRIKRNERPKGEFWDSFEQDFQRRRLHALVERPVWQDFLYPSMKAVGLALPALMLVAVAFFWGERAVMEPSPLVLSGEQSGLTEQESPAGKATVQIDPMDYGMDSRLASSQFVVDAIREGPCASAKFRKVLYTPAISLSAPSGAFYVRDTMQSGSYQVTTADLRLGRNF